MGKLVILGTAFVVPNEMHENTHLAIVGQTSVVLVDCPGRAMNRLRRVGLDPYQINDIILTHFHPDHVDGLPMVIMEMWLGGRKSPLHLYGFQHAMERMSQLMDAYDQATWPNLFPIHYHPIPEENLVPVLENNDFAIVAAPVKHFIPTMGLRVLEKSTGRVLAYSCDTEPCPGDLVLAQRADLLLHEAAGSGWGHSTATQAGEVAQEAQVKRLALIHYNPNTPSPEILQAQAVSTFDGPVIVAQDLTTLEW